MIRNSLIPQLIVLACVWCLPAVSVAQNSDGAVTGSARVAIKRQPQLMRMQLTLSADGKDIVEAVAKLKEAHAACGKKLAELGAAEKSVEFGAIQVGGDTQEGRQQYFQRSRQRSVKSEKKPQMATVFYTAKAEWALKAGTPEELLIGAYTLAEKIKAAAPGKKDAKALTPEEQEILEEAQGMNQGAANPADPVFQYICKISEEDRAAALADAFRQATADAARMAKAAGSELGHLRRVNGIMSSGSGENDDREMYIRQMNPMAATPAITGEATASVPGEVELRVTVTASYDLK